MRPIPPPQTPDQQPRRKFEKDSSSDGSASSLNNSVNSIGAMFESSSSSLNKTPVSRSFQTRKLPPTVPAWKQRIAQSKRQTVEECANMHDSMPLFDSKTEIEYNDDEDDMAAKMYGATAGGGSTNAPQSKKKDSRVSGYNFDELLKNEDTSSWGHASTRW